MYEWDEAKREANLKKHGLDFFVAHLVFENPEKVTYRLKTNPELRFLDVALVQVKGAMLALVYTMRNRNVRFISFRYASRKERRAYAAAKSGSK
ncbi:MAG: BrnT family toxin [Terracidiphilus sp.]